MTEIEIDKERQTNLKSEMLKIKLEYYFYGEQLIETKIVPYQHQFYLSKTHENQTQDKLKMINKEILNSEAKITEFNEKKAIIKQKIVEVELEIVKEKKKIREEQENLKRILE